MSRTRLSLDDVRDLSMNVLTSSGADTENAEAVTHFMCAPRRKNGDRPKSLTNVRMTTGTLMLGYYWDYWGDRARLTVRRAKKNDPDGI